MLIGRPSDVLYGDGNPATNRAAALLRATRSAQELGVTLQEGFRTSNPATAGVCYAASRAIHTIRPASLGETYPAPAIEEDPAHARLF